MGCLLWIQFLELFVPQPFMQYYVILEHLMMAPNCIWFLDQASYNTLSLMTLKTKNGHHWWQWTLTCCHLYWLSCILNRPCFTQASEAMVLTTLMARIMRPTWANLGPTPKRLSKYSVHTIAQWQWINPEQYEGIRNKNLLRADIIITTKHNKTNAYFMGHIVGLNSFDMTVHHSC